MGEKEKTSKRGKGRKGYITWFRVDFQGQKNGMTKINLGHV